MHPCIFCTSFLIVTKESHKIPLPQGYSVKASLPRIRTFLKIVLGRYHRGVLRLEARLAVKKAVFLGLKRGYHPVDKNLYQLILLIFQQIFMNQEADLSPISHLSFFCAWLLRVLCDLPWVWNKMDYRGCTTLLWALEQGGHTSCNFCLLGCWFNDQAQYEGVYYVIIEGNIWLNVIYYWTHFVSPCNFLHYLSTSYRGFQQSTPPPKG